MRKKLHEFVSTLSQRLVGLLRCPMVVELDGSASASTRSSKGPSTQSGVPGIVRPRCCIEEALNSLILNSIQYGTVSSSIVDDVGKVCLSLIVLESSPLLFGDSSGRWPFFEFRVRSVRSCRSLTEPFGLIHHFPSLPVPGTAPDQPLRHTPSSKKDVFHVSF
jgi:hypothetical protein